MASTLNSVPAASSAAGNTANAQTNGRPSLRSSASTKGDGRRQSGSPVDGGQRRTNSHKAWTQGTNPITQRSHASSNGNMSRQSGTPRPNQKESNTPESHSHDRLLFLFASFIGLPTTITTKNGDKFTGIFSSSTLEPSDSSFSLKMVQRASEESQPKSNGVSEIASSYLGTGIDHAMLFDIKDVADISVPNVVPAEVSVKESTGTAGFRTDADISGNLAIRERTLQRWEPAETDVDLSLESAAGDSSGWDQFEANERLFGARTNYDENIYTTVINRSDPAFRQKQAEAARIAREIEGSEVDNPHMREERGLVAPATGDDDEEAKYSGVQRENKAFPPLVSGQPNKYTPPGRRQAGPGPAVPFVKPEPSAKPETIPETPQAPVQDASSAEKLPTPAPTKPAAETEQKTIPSNAPGPAGLPAKRPVPENATANVETEVLDHFRQFANSEKLKMQERRRNQASYDRTVKLNELMKFSKNFKLSTPVPKDLVPILAKDPHKQEAIIQRAHTHDDVDVSALVKDAVAAAAAEKQQAARAPAPTGPAPPAAPSDRQNYPRGRQGFLPTGPLAGPSGSRFPQQQMQPGRPGQSNLSHRLADNLQQRKGGNGPMPPHMSPVPKPLPVQDARGPPTGPASEQARVTSPAKSQTTGKFNVRALEFKPNPAASTFTPGGGSFTGESASSPRPFSRNRSVSRATTPSAFFGIRKPVPVSERPSIGDDFNAIKRMKKEGQAAAEKPYTFNGGIPPPYKTLPTWDAPEGNEEKTYDQMFKSPSGVSSVSPQGRSVSNNPHLPQSHQMPFQFPQGNPGMPASSGPPTGPHVNHPHAPHVDEHHHRMQLSASSSQVFPSPRMQQSHMGYPSPMAPPAQLAYGQPMPQFYGGPQPGPMRHYQAGHGPQFGNPQMGGHMMVQQQSNGPYMGMPQGMPYNPQMQMYSPSPGHAYPQHAPAQPHSGYPSPSRGAPMMMHQNSQPGQPPQGMMFIPGQPGYGGQQPGHVPPGRGGYPQQQPHFSSSPHQPHHFPPNQHRAPNNNFNQVPQIPPQMAASNTPANSGSATHSADTTEESK